MNEQVDLILFHMAKSQRELARILKAEREMATHAAGLHLNIPQAHLATSGLESVREHSGDLSKSISAYLNGLAELEEAMADNLGPVLKELEVQDEE